MPSDYYSEGLLFKVCLHRRHVIASELELSAIADFWRRPSGVADQNHSITKLSKRDSIGVSDVQVADITTPNTLQSTEIQQLSVCI